MSAPFKSLAPYSPRTVELEYFPALVNPLTVDAGPDQTVLGLSGALTGSASVVNGGSVSTLWTVVSGPGQATFDDDTDPLATFTTSEAGAYVFRLTATYGDWDMSDEVSVVCAP